MAGSLFLILLSLSACTELVHYRFWTSTTSVFYDYSHHDNHGEATGETSALSTMGVHLFCDGNPTIRLPDNNIAYRNFILPQEFSLVFWIWTNGDILLFSYANDETVLSLYTDGGDICITACDNEMCTSPSWDYEKWQFVVVTGDCIDLCNIRVYVNGEKIGDLGFRYSSWSYPQETGYGFELGPSWDGCADWYLYEFILMDEEITRGQMQSYMALPNTPQCQSCSTLCSLQPTPVCLPASESPIPSCDSCSPEACEVSLFSSCFLTRWYDGDGDWCCTWIYPSGDFYDCDTYMSADTEDCQPCDRTCLTCRALEGYSDATMCSRCWPHAQLAGPAPSACICDPGYYPSPDSSNCVACPGLCAQCTSATSCIQCKSNAINSGICRCINGYFPAESGTCQLCHSMCETCVSGLAIGCLSCKSGGVLAGTAPAACGCRPEFKLDSALQICCSKECSSCDISGQCQACFIHAQLTLQKTCACLPGYYPNTNSANCALCSPNCRTCTDGTDHNCLSCKESAHILTSTPGPCTCIPGFFPNPDVSACQACGEDCLECLDALSCVNCADGSTLLGGKCAKCPDNCRICRTVGKCNTCLSGYFPTLTGSCNICSTCPGGFYANSTGPIDNSHYNLTFSRPTFKVFDRSDFCVRAVPETPFSWEVSNNGNLTISVSGGPWANVTAVNIHFLTEVTDEFGFELSSRMVSSPPPQDQPATVNATVLNTTVTVAAQVTVSVVGSSAVAAGVSVGGGSAAMALLSQMQYFSYIGTANYSMTGTMNNFYTNLNQKSTFPNFFKRDIKSGQAVAGRRLDSAQDLIEVYDFLDSAGQYLTLIALILVVHALVHLLSRYLGQKWHCLKRLEGSFLWGVYIYFWYFAFLDVQVSALLQLKNSGLNWSSVRPIFCNLLSIFTLLLTFATPILTFLLIFKRQNDLFSPTPHPLKTRIFPIIDSIRSDVQWAKYLYPIYYLQRLLYSFLIVFIRGHPYIQAFSLIIPCGIMAVFVLVTRPLIVKAARVLHIIAEIDSLIVFILLCVATLEYDTPRVDICWVIFAFTAKSFLCTCLIVIVSMVKAVKEACERRKNRNKVVNYTAESLSIEAQKQNVITTTDPDLSFGHEAEWAQRPFEYMRQAKRNPGKIDDKKAPIKQLGLR